ncbi:class I SAM-dependent methyltransferase [Sporosalibacterium faouarense]|uniref:class I SAM-dependent methyltransferase n=1 Tax=Sporosalibacterium faouarense TaxID=516123 RepID=UPI00192C469F|nr:class I SAM-dependent methyltransferase [Sporosalibacterium faouarense]
MSKVDKEFVKNSFIEAISNYSNATIKIGLWESEKFAFNKYLRKDSLILDIGCGTGRTTFGLYGEGFTNITGLDLSPYMITEANRLNDKLGFNIGFVEGDATDLPFKDNSFDNAIFSFNGIMQIPMIENRILALKEVKRILRPGGIFIFTTHDRDADKEFEEFWIHEKELWENENQDFRLYEYGDRLTTSRNESRDIFIHIPDRGEVLNSIEKAGLKYIDDFYRSELFQESEEVKEFSGECRFWIVESS